jgi:hypothetical protein
MASGLPDPLQQQGQLRRVGPVQAWVGSEGEAAGAFEDGLKLGRQGLEVRRVVRPGGGPGWRPAACSRMPGR